MKGAVHRGAAQAGPEAGAAALADLVRDNPGIGRRRLIRLTGMTGYAVAKALRALRRDGPAGAKATAAKAASAQAAPAKTDGGGFCLSRQVRVCDTRPNEGLKLRLFGLARGRAFPIDDIARAWGTSPENVRRHGNRFSAVKWVEVGPGDWRHCVMHPDTAASYGGQK